MLSIVPIDNISTLHLENLCIASKVTPCKDILKLSIDHEQIIDWTEFCRDRRVIEGVSEGVG